MNRIDIILQLADEALRMSQGELHAFLRDALKMLGDAELQTLKLKQDVEAAKQI